MQPLPHDTSDADLIAFVDRWAVFLEGEDYDAAYQFTDHIPEMKWTPSLMREALSKRATAMLCRTKSHGIRPADRHYTTQKNKRLPAVGDVMR